MKRWSHRPFSTWILFVSRVLFKWAFTWYCCLLIEQQPCSISWPTTLFNCTWGLFSIEFHKTTLSITLFSCVMLFHHCILLHVCGCVWVTYHCSVVWGRRRRGELLRRRTECAAGSLFFSAFCCPAGTAPNASSLPLFSEAPGKTPCIFTHSVVFSLVSGGVESSGVLSGSTFSV